MVYDKYPHCDVMMDHPTPDLIINLKYVRFEVWRDQRCVASILRSSSHTCVGSRPDTQENREEAGRQGYTPDENGVWQSLVEHELLHSLVAEVMFDRPSSVILTESGAETTPSWERYEEEAVVLSIQRLLNTDEITATLDRILCIDSSLVAYGPRVSVGWLAALEWKWNEEINPLLESVL